MALTTDPDDPRLERGPDSGPRKQAKAYLVLSAEELEKGFTRPFRTKYVHHKKGCGSLTTINSRPIAETLARDPKFYGYTWCGSCKMHLPVAEFRWVGTDEEVGS